MATKQTEFEREVMKLAKFIAALFVIVMLWVGYDMRKAQAQDFEGPAEPVNPRTWLFEQATAAALGGVSDSELHQCVTAVRRTDPDYAAFGAQRCEQERPEWQRLDGPVAARVP